jgi:hypothetical protein
MGIGVCVLTCSSTYPACNSQASYCHLRPLWLLQIPWQYLVNNTIFGCKLLYMKCMFRFSLQRSFQTFPILRRIQRDIVINVKTSWSKVFPILVWKVTLGNNPKATTSPILVGFHKTWIFSTDFGNRKLKYQISYKFVPRKPSCFMRTDRQTDMTKRIVLFLNFVNASYTTICFYQQRRRTSVLSTRDAISKKSFNMVTRIIAR